MQVNWNWDAERHVVRKALAQPYVQNSLIKTQLLLQQIKHNIKIIEEYHPIKAAMGHYIMQLVTGTSSTNSSSY